MDSPGGRNVVFVDGCRLPFQRSGTGYRDLTSYDLARLALKGLLRRNPLDPQRIERVILGTVISSLQNSNVARDAALAAGIPARVPAFTVSQACVSSNLAITTGFDLIRLGHCEVVVAGGTESLTDIPIRLQRKLRLKLVEAQKVRSPFDYLRLFRGLRPRHLLPEIPSVSEFSTGRTMGEDCDRMAARLGISRAEQDQFALRSHACAFRAQQEGLLAGEIEPVRAAPDFKPITTDNGVRGDTSLEKLGRLGPAFVKPHGTLTAGNSSFLTDGAATVLMMEQETAARLNFTARARIVDHILVAQDPWEELLMGPAYAVPALLIRNGLSLNDIEVFEFHEAFAGQVLANLKALASEEFARTRLKLERPVGEIPLETLNPLGGSLSLGHPFGATGARLVTTAVNRLHREEARLAVVASCAAGGIGNAILLERIG